MDIGGHRFFSKSDRVMQWWLDLMPVEATTSQKWGASLPGPATLCSRVLMLGLPTRSVSDLVMLVRERKSRIYFMRRFFDYPIRLNADTLRKMGPTRTLRSGLSYMRSAMLPMTPRTLPLKIS